MSTPSVPRSSQLGAADPHAARAARARSDIRLARAGAERRRPRTRGAAVVLGGLVGMLAIALGLRGDIAALHAAPATQDEGCQVTGHVTLGGRQANDGVQVGLSENPGPEVETAADGRFALRGVPAGRHRVRAQHTGYLSAETATVSCEPGSLVELAAVALPGGDTDASGSVDLFDLTRIGAHYRQCQDEADFDPRADINASGCVDLFDLVLVSGNYGRSGPVDWSIANGDDPPEAVSYAEDVQPLLTQHCGVCHGASAGLQLGSYEDVMAGSNSGPVVIPGEPQSSSLYLRMSGQVRPAMPPGGVTLPDGVVETVRRWIAAGAPND